MSWKATAAVKALGADRGLSRTEKLVLMCLADYHNDETGACFPSVSRLAGDALTSARHMTRVLAGLSEKGVISIERADGRSSNYRLLCIETPDMVSVLTNQTPDIAMSPTPDIVSPPPLTSRHPTPDIAMSPEPKDITVIEPKGTAIPHVADFLRMAKARKEKPRPPRVSRYST